MIYNKDFKIAEIYGSYRDENDVACIKILTGEFKGVTFNFGSISINEGDESATISFDYDIIDDNKLLTDEFSKKEFEITLEKIMNSLLENILSNEMKGKHGAELRKEDSSETDQG